MARIGHGRVALLTLVASILIAGPAPAEPVKGPLRIHRENPRYFDDSTGRVVFLAGAHVWSNLQDELGQPPVNYAEHLDMLLANGHNFTRGWHWEDAHYTPLPYARTGPGNANDGGPKFDLTKYSQPYFDRIKARAAEAGRRGMYISIMLFEGWSLDKAQSPGRPQGARNPNPWPLHPYHASNNVNNINGDPNGDDDGGETHQLLIPEVTRLQEAYVRKAIDELNDLDNIIWEISNESRSYSVDWQNHMVRFIKEYQKNKPKQHLVWVNARGDWKNQALFDGLADIVSPNNRSGVDYLRNPPAAQPGKQVILSDTDHLVGIGGDRDWAWRTVTRGYQPIFMDTCYPLTWYARKFQVNDPKSVAARAAIGHGRRYAERLDLLTAVPQEEGTLSPTSTGFCLYNPGERYLIYQPKGGPFTVQCPAGPYECEWFDPAAGKIANTDRVNSPGGDLKLTPPFEGPAVMFLTRLVAAPDAVP